MFSKTMSAGSKRTSPVGKTQRNLSQREIESRLDSASGEVKGLKEEVKTEISDIDREIARLQSQKTQLLEEDKNLSKISRSVTTAKTRGVQSNADLGNIEESIAVARASSPTRTRPGSSAGTAVKSSTTKGLPRIPSVNEPLEDTLIGNLPQSLQRSTSPSRTRSYESSSRQSSASSSGSSAGSARPSTSPSTSRTSPKRIRSTQNPSPSTSTSGASAQSSTKNPIKTRTSSNGPSKSPSTSLKQLKTKEPLDQDIFTYQSEIKDIGEKEDKDITRSPVPVSKVRGSTLSLPVSSIRNRSEVKTVKFSPVTSGGSSMGTSLTKQGVPIVSSPPKSFSNVPKTTTPDCGCKNKK